MKKFIFIFLIIVNSFLFCEDKNKILSREYASSIILPLEKGNCIAEGWKFNDIKLIETDEIVYEFKNEKTEEVFEIHLRKRNDKQPAYSRSKNYNIVYRSMGNENRKVYEEIMKKFTELVKKNDLTTKPILTSFKHSKTSKILRFSHIFIVYILLVVLLNCLFFTSFLVNRNKGFKARKRDIFFGLLLILLYGAGLCLSYVHIGFLKPIWFEDIVLMVGVTVLMMLWFYMFRKWPGKEQLFLIFVWFLLFGASIFLLEFFCRKIYPLRGGRIGLILGSEYNLEKRNLLFKSIPEAKTILKPVYKAVTLGDMFSLRDTHLIQSVYSQHNKSSIIHLGDSMTEGAGIEPQYRFATLLEKKMNMPNYVLAIGGTGPDWALRMLERYGALLKPKLVILHFFASNDFGETGREVPACGFKPLYNIKGEELKFNCSVYQEKWLTRIYYMPSTFVLRYLATRTIIGGFLMDWREILYFRLGIIFFGSYNPWKQYDTEGEEYTEKICKLILEIEQLSKKLGAKFGVSMVPGYRQFISKGFLSRGDSKMVNRRADKIISCLRKNKIPVIDHRDTFGKTFKKKGRDFLYLLPKNNDHFNKEGHKLYTKGIEVFIGQLLKN